MYQQTHLIGGDANSMREVRHFARKIEQPVREIFESKRRSKDGVDDGALTNVAENWQ